tara:strand:- start:1848 stop:2702 length:855 start_codon:yes stop_codon:yes gene_type:complete
LKPYYDLLNDILLNGNNSDDRTGTGTLSLFGNHIEFDLAKGFPLLTGKFTPFKLVANELLWFLSGSTNNEELRKLNGNLKRTIWEEWATEDGYLGPIYGEQWRNWGGIDQIETLITGLKERPFSRRHIVSAWNVSDLPNENISPQENANEFHMALAPCHAFFQFGVRKIPDSDKFALSCHLYQRSCDTFLGLPFNIASYALLTEMVANVVGMVPDKLHMSFGDVHIYKNHIDQVKELLARDLDIFTLPELVLDKKYDNMDSFSIDSFEVKGYQYHPSIKAPIAI